jgi:hypothetical protein
MGSGDIALSILKLGTPPATLLLRKEPQGCIGNTARWDSERI